MKYSELTLVIVQDGGLYKLCWVDLKGNVINVSLKTASFACANEFLAKNK
jgi:hypothetical protein